MSDDADYIRVPRARLLEVKHENETLRAERERLAAEADDLRRRLRALTEEHENLKAHLTGSIRELARLRGDL